MNTTELLDELRVAVRRDAAHRARRRRAAAAVVVLTAILLGGVGVAGTYGDWWTGNAPAVQPGQLNEVAQENDSFGIHLDLSKKATVAQTDDAALDAVATNGGKGYCLSLFVGAKGMGTSCTAVADSEYRTAADDTHWIAYGRVLDADAAALDLSGAGLPAHVPLERGGFFLLDIPRAQWPALNERHGDVAVLDGSGHTIRRACVWVGEAPGSPVSGGGVLGDPGQCDVPPPVDPVPDRAKARRLVADGDIALWEAPSVDGRGTCWFTGTAESPAIHVGLGAGGCRSGAEPPNGGENLSTMYGGGVASGFLRPGSGIVRVTLRGDGWTADAAVANDAFITRMPGNAPFDVVGYDKTGSELASSHVGRSG